MTTPKRSNEDLIKEFLEHPALQRLNNIELTAIVTGRASQYEGETLVDCLRTILTEKDAEVEKARKTWLREEIVKLEEKFRKFPEAIGDAVDTTCLGYEQEAYNSALQTIIDRYQAELDQDVTHNP